MTIEAPAVQREPSQACKVTADGEVIVAGDLVAKEAEAAAISSYRNPPRRQPPEGPQQTNQHRLNPTPTAPTKKPAHAGFCLLAGYGVEFLDSSLSLIFR